MTSADGTRETGSRSRCQTPEKEGLTMTMKERLKVHADIERRNRENLKKWKEDQKHGNH